MTEPWNLTEPQRRQLREAQAAAKAARPPYKRWRVAVEGKQGVPFRGQIAAYEYARDLATYGEAIIVHHWENGDWRLHERIEPEGA